MKQKTDPIIRLIWLLLTVITIGGLVHIFIG